MRIDLHTHSTASDGTDTPAQLVAVAAAAGIDVLAITDHDTTGGWDEAHAALSPGMTLIQGVEFSCVFARPDERRISLHLLGYLFDPANPGLSAELTRLRENRRGRGRAIVENMVADGLPISWSQVSDLAAGGAVGRPHIGRALVASGVTADVSAAFAGPLASTSKYHVRKTDTDVFTALALLRSAGGVAVFAHPLARRRGPVVDDDVIAAMAAAGLAGVEVAHPDHAEIDRRHLTGLAAELGLLTTGSSDYHGTNKSTPIGANLSTDAQLEALLAHPCAGAPLCA